MITDEAVEAARSAWLAFPKLRGVDSSADAFRAALEAAAPHLLRVAADRLEDRLPDEDPTSYAEQQYQSGYADAVARLILMQP